MTSRLGLNLFNADIFISITVSKMQISVFEMQISLIEMQIFV